MPVKKRRLYRFPFWTAIYSCQGKEKDIRAAFLSEKSAMLTVNGDALTNDFYRGIYSDAITRGYHCPPVMQPYFNTINLEMNVPKEELLRMIDLSYSYVIGRLPKKIQRELAEGLFNE